jgi:acyl-CoA thioesterase-2
VSDALDELLDLLDLEQIETNIFRGRSPDETVQRVYGGQVAGQALVAAGRTVPPDRPVHSLHAYFIRPGDPAVPLIYSVDRVRDGRSFTTRRVTAIQHGKPIFTLSASFHRQEPGLEYELPMPAGSPSRRTCGRARSTRARSGRCRSRWRPTRRCGRPPPTWCGCG